jgi:hypothetical protein
VVAVLDEILYDVSLLEATLARLGGPVPRFPQPNPQSATRLQLDMRVQRGYEAIEIPSIKGLIEAAN